MARIALDCVRKEFESGEQRICAIQEVTLEIPPGTFASLVGPSGCGKTTLLNIVAGFEPPTAGRAYVGGREVQDAGPDRGVVFQEPGLFPWLRVDENVGFGLRARGMPAAEVRDRVDKILEQVGLAAFKRCYPAELSGGMKQRVAIARVLAMDPAVLLMDEPFGALDAQTRHLMQEFLLQLLEERRKTVLFITHDIEEAIFLADRVYIMSARPGRLKEVMEVALPRPRTVDCLSLPAFHELVDRAFRVVREEAIKAMQMSEGVT
ncbi:MAG: ABC transporter ATP-binding protein [Deltaproteobacteria bacterium]|nr:ABC transporter ATP-binding protein [Deltaproteobacteria bacterium]